MVMETNAFDVVLGIDRSEAQISHAEERTRRRELSNVKLVLGEYDGPEVLQTVMEHGGADVVVAARSAPAPCTSNAAAGPDPISTMRSPSNAVVMARFWRVHGGAA